MPENNKDTATRIAIDTQRPFLGLRSFEEQNKEQYGGRDIEIQEIYTLIKNNGLTVIFGKSGIGKTSLINAGVIPELRKNFYYPIYIRIDFSSAKSPLTQLKEGVYEKLKQIDTSVEEVGNKSLWEYFHNIRLLDGLITPVLILDQFEEIFTLGKDKLREVLEMIIEVSDLAENRIPAEVQKRYADNATMISASFAQRKYHVVLSLREDYLAQLESYKRYMPSIGLYRYRIVQMTAMQALEAATKSSNGLIDKEVAIEIIKKLPDVTERDFDEKATEPDNQERLKIEPFLLSLICFQINEKRIEQNLDNINFELVASFNVQDVINSYYNDTVSQFKEKVQVAFEETLITESGFRKLQSLEELKKEYEVDETILEALINKRIIRKELRDNVEYVELIHDVLRDVVRKKREKRREEIKEKERKETIRKAVEIEKVRQRKRRNIFITVTLVGLLASSIILFYNIKNANDKQRLMILEFAGRLLSIANGIEENYGDYQSAALVSYAAYRIYGNNNGGDLSPFYNSFYNSLERNNKVKSVGPYFAFCSKPGNGVSTINFAGDTVLVGYADGKIYKKSWSDDKDSLTLFYDVGQRITSISINKGLKTMAAAGTFQYIQLFDLTQDTSRSVLMGINSDFLYNNINGKTICYNEQGDLFLRTDSLLAGWQMIGDNHKSIIWDKRLTIKTNNGQVSALEDTIVWGKNHLRINGKKFNCVAVGNEKLAAGVDSAIYIISKDTIIKITDSKLGIVTCVAFDSNTEFALAGNAKGGLCKISLSTYKVEYNAIAHGRIQSIICSNDNKYIVAGSADGSVIIFNAKEDWYLQMPFILRQKVCDGDLNKK
ncbi:MAG: hypothetical protein IPO27_18400 [Bacteroidetes bacterium]|nr:hypothetical protein [Bacteroidota bacterium]